MDDIRTKIVEAIQGYQSIKAIDPDKVMAIAQRFDAEITAFHNCIVTLVSEKDPQGIEILLRMVSGMLLTLPEQLEQRFCVRPGNA